MNAANLPRIMSHLRRLPLLRAADADLIESFFLRNYHLAVLD